MEKRRAMVPRTSLKIWSMPPIITFGRNVATRSKFLISKLSKVLAMDSQMIRQELPSNILQKERQAADTEMARKHSLRSLRN